MKEDKILYLKNQKSDLPKKIYPTEPIKILKDNKPIATIELAEDGLTLIIEFTSGEKFKLWRYYDYSGIDKIEQSQDGNIIRIYHWGSFLNIFPARQYVTEFNIEQRNKKVFKLRK